MGLKSEPTRRPRMAFTLKVVSASIPILKGSRQTMRRKLRQTDSKMIERIAKTWLDSDIGDENVNFIPRFHPNPPDLYQ